VNLPALDDFHHDAIALAALLLGRCRKPTEAEILVIEQALRGVWHAGWVAHAQSLPRRRFR
jgi:hypothetical protein